MEEGIELDLMVSVVVFIAAICVAAKYADVFYMNDGDDDDIL